MTNWHQEHLRQRNSLTDRIADSITTFAGSMRFVYVHVLLFAIWCGTGLFGFDAYPFNFLTMTVSLEAIFLATFVMIGQNRTEQRDKVAAEHQYEHQERELKAIRDLVSNDLQLTSEVHTAVGELTRVRQALESAADDLGGAAS